PALDCPLDADHGGMHAQALCDRDDYGIFDIDRVLRSAVALGTRGRADWRVADRLYIVGANVIEQRRLLEVRGQFHFIQGRPDARVAKQQLELRDRYVGGADVADQAIVDKLFHLPPGLHELLVNVRLRVRASRFDRATGRVEIRKGPMNQVGVEVAAAQVF